MRLMSKEQLAKSKENAGSVRHYTLKNPAKNDNIICKDEKHAC